MNTSQMTPEQIKALSPEQTKEHLNQTVAELMEKTGWSKVETLRHLKEQTIKAASNNE